MEMLVDVIWLRILVRQSHILVSGVAFLVMVLDAVTLVVPGFVLRDGLHKHVMRFVLGSLVFLMITGAFITMIDVRGDFWLVLEKPKLLAKVIFGVGTLAVVATFMHTYVARVLKTVQPNPTKSAFRLAIIGSFSFTGWIYTVFSAGMGPLVLHPYNWGLREFAVLYASIAVGSMFFTLTIARPRLERFIEYNNALLRGS